MISSPRQHELILAMLAGRACQASRTFRPALPAIDRLHAPARLRKLRKLAAVELVIRPAAGGGDRAVMISRIDVTHVLSAANISEHETPLECDPALWACYRAVWMARQEIRHCLRTRRSA